MILLINPPFYRFLNLQQDYVPLSLLAVGSQMVQEGTEVLIKNMEVGGDHYAGYSERADHYDLYTEALSDDTNSVWLELKELIEKIHPDKIGINVVNVKYESALKIIKIATEYNIPVIVGGNHPTLEPESYPENVEVFCGEYESRGNRLRDLDETPMPIYDILLDKYSPNGYAHILSARGCPYRCNFCASAVMWGHRVTYKSIDRIIIEMRYVYGRFKSDYFTFWDETFTANKRRLAEFCSKYDIAAHWRCDTRADSITDEMVRMMKASGCGQMSLGIESGDENILESIKKGETTYHFRRAAEILARNEIEWKAYMIIGFPEDTEETILKSIEFVKSLKPFRITLSFFTPYKGTELYDQVLIDNKLSLFSHQSPHNYFCSKIPKERYFQMRDQITKDIDDYNQEALKTWT